MRRILFVVALSLCIVGGAEGKIRVFSTISPIASIISMVADNNVSVHSLVATSGELSKYKLHKKFEWSLKNSDVIVYIDPTFEEFIAPILPEIKGQAFVISKLDSIRLLSYRGQVNWHLWFDIDNVKVILHGVVQLLSHLLPEYADKYYAKYSHVVNQLEKIQIEMQNDTKGLPPILLLSPGLEYFFNNLHISPFRLYDGDTDALQNMVAYHDIKCVFVNETYSIDKIRKALPSSVRIISFIENEKWSGAALYDTLLVNKLYEVLKLVNLCRQ